MVFGQLYEMSFDTPDRQSQLLCFGQCKGMKGRKCAQTKGLTLKSSHIEVESRGRFHCENSSKTHNSLFLPQSEGYLEEKTHNAFLCSSGMGKLHPLPNCGECNSGDHEVFVDSARIKHNCSNWSRIIFIIWGSSSRKHKTLKELFSYLRGGSRVAQNIHDPNSVLTLGGHWLAALAPHPVLI